jgi:hypothetical protein
LQLCLYFTAYLLAKLMRIGKGKTGQKQHKKDRQAKSYGEKVAMDASCVFLYRAGTHDPIF